MSNVSKFNEMLAISKELNTCKDHLDNYIWDVFKRYVQESSANYSNMYTWKVEEDGSDVYITFIGDVGAKGYYESTEISVPVKYFINTEAAFLELRLAKEEALNNEKEELEKLVKEKEEEERLLLAQLKDKYDSVH